MKQLIGAGDVIVGDRLYCTYANICWMLDQGAEVVFRKHQQRKGEKVKTLGPNDHIVSWTKPHSKGAHSGVTRLLWDKLRPTLQLREVTFKVACKGYRTREVTLITTLLDPEKYPLEDLAELYLKRWRIELWFDDIKTSMQMDVLRCKTPEMIEKEVLMHMIAYNLVRSVMQAAATSHGERLEALSFKGTVDRLREWAWPIYNAANAREREAMKSKLLKSIAEDLLEHRPGRYEPRVVKRRPKAYPAMKKPRQEYRDEFTASQVS
jgi:IS4 transposase